MNYPSGFRRWPLALALCVIAVVAGGFVNPHAPFALIPVAALVYLPGVGGWRLSGRQTGAWAVKPV